MDFESHICDLPIDWLKQKLRHDITLSKNIKQSLRMEIICSVKCIQGEPAIQICKDQKCNQMFLICKNTNCGCKKIHESCHDRIQIRSIIDKLNQQSYNKNCIIQDVITWLQLINKKIIAELDDLKTIYSNKQKLLSDINLDIHQFFKSGNQKSIKKQILIEYVLQDKNNNKQYLAQVNAQLKKQYVLIEKIIDKVKRFKQLPIKKQSFTLKFSNQLHHPGILVLSQTMIRSIKKGSDKFALLEPSIQTLTNAVQKLKFRIVKTQSKDLMFGICHLRTVMNNKFTWKSSAIGHGIYAVNACNGYTISHLSQHQNLKASKIQSIQLDDVVEVTYQSGKNKILITNLNKNKSVQIVIKHEQNNPFYGFVRMFSENDQVQFIGSSSLRL